MPESRAEALRIVQEFHEQLVALYGERLKGVYLYGSFARGDAREDSDIDVAVVLEGPVNARQESKRTIALVSGLSLRENCLLMPLFISEDDYGTRAEAIHRSIVREGIPA